MKRRNPSHCHLSIWDEILTLLLSPSTPLFSSSEAVDETKPKDSARQDEGKGEEREADQEHAWTSRNGFPRPHSPLSWTLSLLTLFLTPLWSFPSCPAHVCESVLSHPLALFLSVWQTFKKKKKAGTIPSQTVWLKHFCFLVLLWQVFGNDDPIIWEILALYPSFLIWCVWPCGSPLSSLFLSVPSVCAMFRSSEESKISSEFKTIFLFLLFNVMEWTKRKKKIQKTQFVLKINK